MKPESINPYLFQATQIEPATPDPTMSSGVRASRAASIAFLHISKEHYSP